MKVNFVSHLHPLHFSGGGEQITKKIILEGRRRRHDIRIVAMRPPKYRWISLWTCHRSPDMWILFDVFNCPEERWHFGRHFINRIISSGAYVYGQNAYGDICPLNALPCNGRIGDGKRCVEEKKRYIEYRGNRRGWKGGRCPVSSRRRLFAGAQLNIFLSPLHAAVFHGIYPEIKERTFVLKPLIDVDMFYDMGLPRDIPYASYGGGSEAKGFFNIMERFPHEKVVLLGSRRGRLAEKYDYGVHHDRIPYEEMPRFLNRVQTYVHIPRWPEPHGLIVNQAALCGCNLITNENVGACTHAFDMRDRAAYGNGAAELWERIEVLAGMRRKEN